MRQTSSILLAALLLTGCGTSQGLSGDPNAVLTGAAIGGNVGSAIGGLIGESSHDWRGGYRGSAIGTIVGTLAGAAIGNAITTPKNPKNERQRPATQPYNEALDALRICHIRFIDEGRNQTVNAGEDCKIIFEIVNEGEQVACNVIPSVSERSGMKHIYISPSVMVEQIDPGEGVKYTAHLTAGRRLKAGELVIRLAVTDENGSEYDWQEFTLPTSREANP